MSFIQQFYQDCLLKFAPMGKRPGRKNFESRCDDCKKLPEQGRNELFGAHCVALSGLCRVAGRAQNSHEYGRLGKAAGWFPGIQRK